MGTVAVAEQTAAIVLAGAAELLGPESQYAIQRSALRDEYTAIIEAAKAVEVTDADSAEKAVELGRLLQNGSKETEAFFKRIKVQIDSLKKPILEAEKKDLALIDTEKARLGKDLTTYRTKVEEERMERQRIAEAEAAAKAKLEREELERQAREEQLALAVEFDVSGDHEQAEAVLNEPTYVEEPIVERPIVQAAAPTKFVGSTGRTNFKGVVIGWGEKMQDQPDSHPGWKNFKLLVDAVAAGRAPLRSLLPNESFIGSKGRNEKQGFSLPGCELKRDVSTSFRG